MFIASQQKKTLSSIWSGLNRNDAVGTERRTPIRRVGAASNGFEQNTGSHRSFEVTENPCRRAFAFGEQPKEDLLRADVIPSTDDNR